MPRGATPRSRRRRPMPSTCRRTFSHASAIGANPLPRMPKRPVSRRNPGISHDPAAPMDYQVYAYLQLGRTRRPRPSSTRRRPSPAHGDIPAGPYALVFRRRATRGTGATGSGIGLQFPQPAASGAGDHLFCPCPRRARPAVLTPQADIARLAELRDKLRGRQGRLLVGASDIQRQVAGRLGALCRRQAG